MKRRTHWTLAGIWLFGITVNMLLFITALTFRAGYEAGVRQYKPRMEAAEEQADYLVHQFNHWHELHGWCLGNEHQGSMRVKMGMPQAWLEVRK